MLASLLLLLFVLLLLLVAVMATLRRWPLNIRPSARGFPEARGHWLLGVATDPALAECFDFGQKQLLDAHGTDTLVMRVLVVPMLVTRDPAIIRHVLGANSDNYVKPRGLLSGYQELEPFLGKGLLLLEGATWRAHRKIVNPAFAPAYLRGLVPAFAMVGDRLGRVVRDLADARADVDLQAQLIKTTVDIIGEAGFGTSFGCLDGGDSALPDAVFTALVQLEKRLRNPLHVVFDRNGNKQFKNSVDLLHRIIFSVIDRKRREGTNDTDKSIIAYLMRAQQDQAASLLAGGEARYTDQDLVDEVMTFLLAGHETTATTLTWAFRLLLQQPAVLAKLVREVDEVVPRGTPLTFESIQPLVYMEAVIKETLRLYPPIAIGRCAVADDAVAGGVIAKGSIVGISVCGLHRNRRIWGETADEFRPERWFEDSISAAASTGYMPFALGHRSCVGMQFAHLEMRVLLAQLLREFAFTYKGDPTEPLRPVQQLTLRPVGGCIVRATVRS